VQDFFHQLYDAKTCHTKHSVAAFFLNDHTEKNKIPIIAGKVFVVGLEVFRVFSWENTVYIIMS